MTAVEFTEASPRRDPAIAWVHTICELADIAGCDTIANPNGWVVDVPGVEDVARVAALFPTADVAVTAEEMAVTMLTLFGVVVFRAGMPIDLVPTQRGRSS